MGAAKQPKMNGRNAARRFTAMAPLDDHGQRQRHHDQDDDAVHDDHGQADDIIGAR